MQLRRGRWDEERGRDAGSSGCEDDDVPAVRPGNMSRKEWELLQEARELEQGAFAFDKSVLRLLCVHPSKLSQAACRSGLTKLFNTKRINTSTSLPCTPLSGMLSQYAL